MTTRKWFAIFVGALLVCTLADSSYAAECECAPAARLVRAVEGTFSLRQGESIDLTKSSVLLTFSATGYRSGNRQTYVMRINGKEITEFVGARFNLKKFTSRLQDRDECWLDFYRVVRAKGAPLTASFRLDCP